MSAVDEQTDLDAIEHLDFEVRCEVQVETGLQMFGVFIPLGSRGPCEKPAMAIIACRRCRGRANVCAAHGLVILGSPVAICASCGATASGVELFEFTPVRGH